VEFIRQFTAAQPTYELDRTHAVFLDREWEGGSSYMNSIPAIQSVGTGDSLLTAEEVAAKLKVSTDWVWDHSSRKLPYLPVIRMSDGVLRYRASGIEEFLQERERASNMRRKRR
jgi:predicted DNA-binding transcriptional regulator AlpA